jgi:soluble lytic murein transglycosylase
MASLSTAAPFRLSSAAVTGRPLLTSTLLLGLAVASVSGCAPEIPLPAMPPPPAPPPPAVVIAAPVAAPAPALPPPDPSVFEPARVTLVLDDARLAPVKAEADREAFARAAQLLTGLLGTAAPSAEDRRAWLYQLGRLRALGGDPGGAAKAFEESAATPWALSDYARLQAAQWLVGIGQHDAALAAAKGVGGDAPLGGAVDLVIADALLGKGDFEGAAKRFRSFLGREKHPAQWVTVALRFAGALLQHPSEAHAEEAARLARRVQWEATGGQGAGAAKDLEKQALDTLPAKRRKVLETLSADEQLARAKGLLASGQPREAVLVTDKIIKLPKAKKAGELGCETWLVRGEALVKMRNKKPEAADAYKGAIEHCDGQARRADALFAGGRASASAGRHLEATERFALLERELPAHRFADDARLRGARAALEAGDEPRFTRMLGRIADDYPEGDVSGDGLFELGLFHIGKGDWAGAVAPLEKALARAPRERAYWASGRLPYYLARAHLQLGQPEKGYAELGAVIRDYPLSYYMALAHARLAEHDPAAARRAIAEAAAREPEGTFSLPRGPWLDDPGFARALELLRQGDGKLARGELDKLGFSARTAPREVLWTAAFLLAREGAYTQSHSVLRSASNVSRPQNNELVDWLEHYPTGRWRAAWEIAYPRPFVGIVAPEAKRQGLPEAWAYAIMREESAFDPRVVSPAKAFGLMQLILPTARKMGEKLNLVPDEESLKQPGVNVPIGCHYLTVLRGQFPDNPLLAIPGYNAGAGAPKKWIGERPTDDFDLWVERIPYEETRNYTKRVIGTMAAYEFLYARDQPSEALRAPLAASPSARGGVASAP